ncbi:DUF6355 family natural product biosynthesis protein [Amycolatopsis magusensis]|uniref:DUF6355 family natural product biosynthesis protein n=1 Tax=Amycolatopsis magusensis TaxID=882444 RepID=UPI0037A042A7
MLTPGKRSLIASTAAVFAVLAIGVTGPAEARAEQCGFWEGGPSAFYTHCTSDGSHIQIRVERENGLSGYYDCAYPNRNYLGFASQIKYAWYTGRSCP